MNCDAFAPFYEVCERLAFGDRLERHRTEYLDAAADAKTALVLGDGDGRFLGALASRYPELQIDCIELSPRMLGLAKSRIKGERKQQVQFLQADVLTTEFPARSYDVIYSHFLLDCFTSEQVSCLARKVANVSHSKTKWVITDFRQAASGWRRFYTTAWLKTMYLFFRLVTKLETQRLPDHFPALKAQGFQLRSESTSMAGLIVSECWQRYGAAV